MIKGNDQENTINVFVSYSHRDTRWFERSPRFEFIPWLEATLRGYGIKLWYDLNDAAGIEAGDDFKEAIEKQIDSSQIALLMITDPYLTSDFVKEVEIPRIRKRMQEGKLTIIPVLLEKCGWERFDFIAPKQMIPSAKPLIEYEATDWEFSGARSEILEKIRERAEKINLEPIPPDPSIPPKPPDPPIPPKPPGFITHLLKRRTTLLAVCAAIAVLVVVAIVLAISQFTTSNDQPLDASSAATIDEQEYRQGHGSMKWEFHAEPEQVSLLDRLRGRGTLVSELLHMEVFPDDTGSIAGMDLTGYKQIKFYARSSSEGLAVSEFNLFAGPDYFQYTYGESPLLVNTKWVEYSLDLNGFNLAPWESEYRGDLIPSGSPLSDVTALGFDIKAEAPNAGTIWVDQVRLVNSDGSEITLSDCDNSTFSFQQRNLRWKAEAVEVPR